MEYDRIGWSVQEWCDWFDSAQFDREYVYGGDDLGVSYMPDRTLWKIWTPVAQKVSLNLYTTGSDQEVGAARLRQAPMIREACGVWSISLGGDWKGTYYTFSITWEGEEREVMDPYARAAGVNGNRAMVVDLEETNPAGWEKDTHIVPEHPTDAVIWEVHVRDFSWDSYSGMKNKGQYLAFTEKGTHIPGHPKLPTGVEYLKRLGITHVHLMPCFDFYTIDETRGKEDLYNWGYDPQNYNVPEGSYSTDPYHGEVRIREMKKMIQALHQAGIGVIMDVVYNHTYQSDESAFQKAVPYYYYRTWSDGSWANGSGCGNEIATERPMVSRFIRQSVRYWAEEYHIDGFRFDLMGLIDVETMNRIREDLDQLPQGKKILMYGEPWAAETPQMRRGAVPADKTHVRLLNSRIAIFNDETRDCIKGSVFDMHSTGFISGAWYQENAVRSSLQGWAGPYATVKLPTQTVSYVSAHDNFTLWDKLVYAKGLAPKGFDVPELSCLAANKLAAVIVLMAQGIPFMQAGEEFGRSKKGDGNSYRSSSQINYLDWRRTMEFRELLDYYQGLIQIRKRFAPFRCASGDSIRKMVFSKGESQVVAFTLPGIRGDSWRMAAVVLNASDQITSVELSAWEDTPLPSGWSVKADAEKAGTDTLWRVEGNCIFIQPRSALILVDEAE